MTNLSDYPNCKFVRTFDIEAISLPIVYNKYGDHDPNGMLYVLKKDSERIQQKAREHFAMQPPQPYKEVQPLVIRANAGDEIRINFYNKLDRNVSMHVQGLHYNVLTSDGANVGNNPDTTTNSMIQYVWYAEKEGVIYSPTWVMHEAVKMVRMYTDCLVPSLWKNQNPHGVIL